MDKRIKRRILQSPARRGGGEAGEGNKGERGIQGLIMVGDVHLTASAFEGEEKDKGLSSLYRQFHLIFSILSPLRFSVSLNPEAMSFNYSGKGISTSLGFRAECGMRENMHSISRGSKNLATPIYRFSAMPPASSLPPQPCIQQC